MSLTWQKLYKNKAHHIVLWMAYFLFFMNVYRDFYSSVWQLLLVTFVFFLFHASTFYVIGYYFFPQFLYRGKYVVFGLSAAALLLVESIGLTGYMYTRTPQQHEMGFVAYARSFFASYLMTIATLTAVFCIIKMIADKIKSDRAAREREKEQIMSELQFLKAQVNPHFLFNAINSIYFLITKDPGHAASTLIKLSDLLRFQLYDCKSEKISIEQEVEYLRNFVTIEEIRKGSKTKVDFDTSETLRGFEIAPFMLIPFLENTFKHVSNSSPTGNRISIKMWRTDESFHAHFFNTIDNQKRLPHEGIGHKNVKRRLELIYPDKHELDILEKPGAYEVKLTLTIP